MEEGKKRKKPRGVARLIPGRCIACGARCQSSCPKDAIEMTSSGEPIVSTEKCTGCHRCLKVCPVEALEIYYSEAEKMILADIDSEYGPPIELGKEALSDQGAISLAKNKEHKDVWIFIEQTESEPALVSWELLGVGTDLARALRVELCSVVIGNQVDGICQESFAYGAAKSYLIDDPIFKFYRTEPYYRVICYLVDKYKPPSSRPD
jgi:electron transfer flavoprotein alpha subunit